MEEWKPPRNEYDEQREKQRSAVKIKDKKPRKKKRKKRGKKKPEKTAKRLFTASVMYDSLWGTVFVYDTLG